MRKALRKSEKEKAKRKQKREKRKVKGAKEHKETRKTESNKRKGWGKKAWPSYQSSCEIQINILYFLGKYMKSNWFVCFCNLRERKRHERVREREGESERERERVILKVWSDPW